MAGFLEGVRVLDLSEGVAGPACAKLLADWGADVVKVERPVEGDRSRAEGPFVGDLQGAERSLNFLYQNANKRSVTLNIAAPASQGVFEELVGWADLLVEGYEPAEAEQLGVTYARLSALNPGLVMVSVTSFGHNGPYRDYHGTTLVESALSGLLHHTGAYDREPVMLGNPQGAYLAAINGGVGAMAALLYRDQTGLGQHVDISVTECLAMVLSATELSAYLYTGGVMRRAPMRSQGVNQITPCADGYIVPIPQRDWEGFAKFLEAPELLDGRFTEPTERLRLGHEIFAIISKAIADKGRYELFHGAQALGFPFGVVQTTAELAECPQLESRDFWTEVDHPVAGHLRYPGVPFRPSRSTPVSPTPAPLLGEHNREIFEGLLGHDLAELEREGALSL